MISSFSRLAGYVSFLEVDFWDKPVFSLPILFKIPGFNTKETYDKFILSKTVETFIDRKKSTFLTHTVHQKAVMMMMMMMMMMLDDVRWCCHARYDVFPPHRSWSFRDRCFGKSILCGRNFRWKHFRAKIESSKIKGFETDQMAQNQYSFYEALDTPL